MTPDARYVSFDVGCHQPGICHHHYAGLPQRTVPAGFTFYFAEGYTGAGFQEYLCLGNPGDTDGGGGA